MRDLKRQLAVVVALALLAGLFLVLEPTWPMYVDLILGAVGA